MKKQFIGKTDSNFTIGESKVILSHLLKEYFEDESKNENMTFNEMVFAVANDFGLSPKQIRDSFSQPGLSKIIAKLELKQNEVVQDHENFAAKMTVELNKPFIFKEDYKFTPQETADIFNYLNKEYLENVRFKKVKFNDIMQAVGEDLGLTSKQVRVAISQPDKRKFRQLTRLWDEKVRIHYERVKHNNNTIRWVKTKDYPKIIRFLYLTNLWTWFLKQRKTK